MPEAVTPLLSCVELQGFDPAQCIIVDCRFDLLDVDAGYRQFQHAHLPGAVYADLNQDLSDLSRQAWGLGRHPLPSAATWAGCLARWGWSPEHWLIAYDDAGGAMAAARLWWLARASGIQRVAVLDGGLKAWLASGGATESGPAALRPAAAIPELEYDRTLIASAEELTSGPLAGTCVLLDARAAPRFRGEYEPIDPVAGHIPGAINRPLTLNLNAEGRFLPQAELRASFEALLAGRAPSQLVHMCGSGVSACHNLLAMEWAGLRGSRLYPASWSGWISEPRRKLATGA